MNPNLEFESMLPGLVCDYEAREVAIFSGYKWVEWRKLEWFERASAVAHYRMHFLVEAHVQDAIRKKPTRRSR